MQLFRCAIGAASIAVALQGLLAAPAFAHAALTGSTPEDGARLGRPPTEVTVSYAEPPTTESRFAVLDGCDRDVTGDVAILNQTIDATVDGGEPGSWTIEWSVVSAVDGHLTSDAVSFRVRGRTDCSAAPTDPATDEAADRTASSVPLIPIAAATLVIVGIAIAIRVRSRGDTDE
ncbi:MAG TPA: copper resistance CopC family protein [Actinomycetota bacterium]|nr:copper resistance CopC family protein [Actinomycetota bacterium]